MEQVVCINPENFNLKDYERFIIVADVGGEHSYIAIAGIKSKKNYEIIFKDIYLTTEITKIHYALNKCLEGAYKRYGIEIGRAVIAAAGPVSRKRGYIKLTNIDLVIDSQEILKNTMLRKVILLNDFEAIGYGIDMLNLNTDAMMMPHVGEDLTNPSLLSNTYAVIGAGKGLGVTIAYYDIARHMHVPLPSEGGHIEFSAHDSLELELMQYVKERIMKKKDAHPEFERFVSGNGIINIYNFLRHKKMFPETSTTKKIDGLEGISKLREIDNNLSDPTCKKTVDMFLVFYARAARNLALTAECYSGLFIGGGIILRYANLINQNKAFMKEFESHDLRSDVLRKTPVYIIKNKDVGLLGCCNVAVNFFNLI